MTTYWRDEAACTVCARCPVSRGCAEDAWAMRDEYGFRAGLSGEERERLIRRERRANQPARRNNQIALAGVRRRDARRATA